MCFAVASLLAFAAACGHDAPPEPAAPLPSPTTKATATTPAATPGPTAAAAATAPASKPAAAKKARQGKTSGFELQGDALKLPGPVVFEVGTDKIEPDSEDALNEALDFLTAKPDITTMRIEGHSDNDGPEGRNQTLTEQRAMAVARWLIARGVSCGRLVPVGFGSTKPIAPNDTPENKAQNRRITFANAALRNRPIGGRPLDGGGKPAGDPCR